MVLDSKIAMILKLLHNINTFHTKFQVHVQTRRECMKLSVIKTLSVYVI